ncbi:hypothetical protein [Nocardia nepalensis]|uniref:hypothetical protein n=1 Tax=Nocardia nepalensis TaxID=3375448 RepID=UPI003B685989
MGVPVLLGAGSQRDVSTSQRSIEFRVPVAAQHPAAVNRLTLCSNAADGFVRIVRTGQRIMVDQGHIHPRSAGGIGLSGEMLIDAGRVYYIGWHEENHKRSLPPTPADSNRFPCLRRCLELQRHAPSRAHRHFSVLHEIAYTPPLDPIYSLAKTHDIQQFRTFRADANGPR